MQHHIFGVLPPPHADPTHVVDFINKALYKRGYTIFSFRMEEDSLTQSTLCAWIIFENIYRIGKSQQYCEPNGPMTSIFYGI